MDENLARCFNCHFMGISNYTNDDISVFSEVGKKERNALASGGKASVQGGYLYCFHKVWSGMY